jgi:hypothetical protein
MARKASRGAAPIGPAGLPSPSLHRETPPEEVSERPFSLLKSSDPNSTKNDANVEAAMNDGTLSNAGETGYEDEYNDFIECLGYPPPRKEKRIEHQSHENEEYNDFIECLGYPPPRT